MTEKAIEKVNLTDASEKMLALAAEYQGLNLILMRFSELNAVAYYDGIWANFSLLHAERTEFPHHIAAAATALVPSGIFYLAVKSGTGEGRDDLGRLYTYYTQDELVDAVSHCGLAVIHTFTGRSAGMSGHLDEWVGLLCRK